MQRIVGVERQPHHGRDEGAHRGRADHERLLRHDVEAVARVDVAALEVEQLGGDARAVGGRADQNHDLRRAEAAVERLADAFHEGRRLVEALHRDVPFVLRPTAGPLRRIAVGVREQVVQRIARGPVETARRDGRIEFAVQAEVVRLGDAADRRVVEADDHGQRTPILLEVPHLDVVGAERRGGTAAQNAPVAAAPAVDRLFDVAHEQHRLLVRLRQRVLQQGQKILPLLDRGVLKLVDHEAVEAVAHLLVDEGGVVAADELGQQVFRLRQEHQLLFVAELLYAGVEIAQQGEAAVGLAQQRSGVAQRLQAVVRLAQRAEQRLQHGAQPLRQGVGFAPRLVLRAGRGDAAAIGTARACGQGVEPADEAPLLIGEIVRRSPCFGDEADGLRSRVPQRLFGRGAALRHAADDRGELFARTRRGEGLLVLLLEQLAAERQDPLAHVPAAPLLDALLDEAGEPGEQRAVCRDALDERVGALGEDRGGLDLDVVVQVEVQLLQKGAQDALEEGVDRQHREARIVVQDAGARLGGAAAHGLLREAEFAAETFEVAALFARGEAVDLLQDAALHLLGGLVREGHGEDVTVDGGLFDHVADVFVGQLIGLARSGARIQDFRSHVVNVRTKSRSAPFGREFFCKLASATGLFSPAAVCR